MLFRLLIATLFVALAFFLIRRLRRGKRTKDQLPNAYAETVACHKCGILVPKDEAVEKDGRLYCSEEHSQE
ncbi:hypothetical protein Tel_00755 [Candidatus Tenderia electrophaga]|jgi:ribosomal protein S26|uniref:Preprotein translocase subunit YajC n=1 Tax=Candidatus Tenderia electrophaga TaxID=1748243 RepID=A0A0S2T9F5_9GAMM|nr:hypothetical protein Tel_00755 [Candidatus Tenderia electrophaga]